MKSVGVMGDARTYENACAIRVVSSQDAMTADWELLPVDVLRRISNRIINEVEGPQPRHARHLEQAACHHRVGVG